MKLYGVCPGPRGYSSKLAGAVGPAAADIDLLQQRRAAGQCGQWHVVSVGSLAGLYSAVFTCIGALGTPSRTGPLVRKYLPGFPYSWSLRRLRHKMSSIYCTVICNYPSAAQEQPFTVGLFCITKTVKLTRHALLVFVRSYSSINNKIISLKKYFTTARWGTLKKKENPGALGTCHCPVCPLVKTALGLYLYTSASCFSKIISQVNDALTASKGRVRREAMWFGVQASPLGRR